MLSLFEEFLDIVSVHSNENPNYDTNPATSPLLFKGDLPARYNDSAQSLLPNNLSDLRPSPLDETYVQCRLGD